MKRRFGAWFVVCLVVVLASTKANGLFGQIPQVKEVPVAIPEHVQKVLEIESLLGQPIDNEEMIFDKLPFADVCAKFEFNVILDQSAIDDSLQWGTLITSPRLKTTVSNDEFLTIILRSHNATFIVEENGLRVISMDSAHEPQFFATRFINCRNLLEKIDKSPKATWNFRFPKTEKWAKIGQQASPPAYADPKLKIEGTPFTPTEQLARLVIANVTPDEWAVTQGEGELQFFDGILVVNSSWAGTRRVEKFIRELEYAYSK